MILIKAVKDKEGSKGFTLVELLVALTILLLVIVLSYNFYYYFVRSFDISIKQSEVQQNVRMAVDFIESRVKNASLEIMGDNSQVQQEGYESIYVDSGIIKHFLEGETENLLGNLASNINMQVSFEQDEDYSSLLCLEVTGDIDGDNSYSISTKFLIKEFSEDSESAGSAVRMTP
jgi:prepilin-type N-terminal cleavage/methylation domain-containing protein